MRWSLQSSTPVPTPQMVSSPSLLLERRPNADQDRPNWSVTSALIWLRHDVTYGCCEPDSCCILLAFSYPHSAKQPLLLALYLTVLLRAEGEGFIQHQLPGVQASAQHGDQSASGWVRWPYVAMATCSDFRTLLNAGTVYGVRNLQRTQAEVFFYTVIVSSPDETELTDQ